MDLHSIFFLLFILQDLSSMDVQVSSQQFSPKIWEKKQSLFLIVTSWTGWKDMCGVNGNDFKGIFFLFSLNFILLKKHPWVISRCRHMQLDRNCETLELMVLQKSRSYWNLTELVFESRNHDVISNWLTISIMIPPEHHGEQRPCEQKAPVSPSGRCQ